jgi:hypothetical protein
MTYISIRGVPEPLRDRLAEKARAAHQSLNAYLLAELEHLAATPTMTEWLDSLPQVTGVSGDEAIDALRAVRDES